MKRVSAVFTEHEESGLANAGRVARNPGAHQTRGHLLECPPAAFDNYLRGDHTTLEPTAGKIAIASVIRLTSFQSTNRHHEAAFFADFRDLIDRIALTGPEYDTVASWHRQYVSAYGLAYLNSAHCSDIFSKRHEAVLAGIAKLADQRLAKCYDCGLEPQAPRLGNDREISSVIADALRSVELHFSWRPTDSPSLTCQIAIRELLHPPSSGISTAFLRNPLHGTLVRLRRSLNLVVKELTRQKRKG